MNVCAAGKHSGRNALRTKLQALGLELSQEQLDDVFKRFKVNPPRLHPLFWIVLSGCAQAAALPVRASSSESA